MLKDLGCLPPHETFSLQVRHTAFFLSSLSITKNDQIVLLFFRSSESLPEASSTVDIANLMHVAHMCMYNQ